MWLFVHLLFLMGVRSRAAVFLHWVWSCFTWGGDARVIQSSWQEAGLLRVACAGGGR